MTIVSITPVSSHQGETIFRAFCQGRESTGKTEGEALDGLTAQLGPDEPNLFVVLQRFQDDDLFTGVQKQQLQELMTRWRGARDSGRPFPVEDVTNYALACRACNLFKTDCIECLDSETDEIVRLFHPRDDHWDHHFEIDTSDAVKLLLEDLTPYLAERAARGGILKSHRVLSILSKHSTRDPGVCLDEVAIAVGVKGGNIQTILVESETEVQPPPSINHIQWLDMHDWKEKRDAGDKVWKQWYAEKLAEIIQVVESEESRRFAGEIEELADYLNPSVSDFASDSRIRELLKKEFVGRKWLFDAVEQWRTAPAAAGAVASIVVAMPELHRLGSENLPEFQRRLVQWMSWSVEMGLPIFV